jgi:hypothetical protein
MTQQDPSSTEAETGDAANHLPRSILDPSSEWPVERAWGFMEGGKFTPLPKRPMLLACLGPPPFDVELPSGEVRHIIEEPLPECMP